VGGYREARFEERCRPAIPCSRRREDRPARTAIKWLTCNRRHLNERVAREAQAEDEPQEKFARWPASLPALHG
jgi:hypothetical protein